MTPEFIMSIGKDAIEVILMLSAPVLLAGMAVGLAVSIFQAVTQIQEATLSFVPKILAVFIALLALAPWMMEIMLRYTGQLFANIPNYIR